jgi:hypothetical protein
MFRAAGFVGTLELFDELRERPSLETGGEHRRTRYALPTWLRCLGSSSPE